MKVFDVLSGYLGSTIFGFELVKVYLKLGIRRQF